MIHVYAIHLPTIGHDSDTNTQSVEHLLPLLAKVAPSTQPAHPSLSVQEDISVSVSCTAEWEAARIRRFRHSSDQLRTLAGTLLLRVAVYQVTGQWPAIYRTPLGKPVAHITSTLDGQGCLVPVSISHTGPWIAVSVAPRGTVDRVGIDITSLDAAQCVRAADTLAMYEPLLSNSEQQWIALAPNDREALFRFACCWTVKEAVLKCLGSGLTGALDPLKAIEHNMDTLPETDGRAGGAEWRMADLAGQERLVDLPIPSALLPRQQLLLWTCEPDANHVLSLIAEPVSTGSRPLCPQAIVLLTVDDLMLAFQGCG